MSTYTLSGGKSTYKMLLREGKKVLFNILIRLDAESQIYINACVGI